jgi:hypothetical protein
MLEHMRAAMFRALPLSEHERESFAAFNGHLKRQLDAIEDELRAAGRPTDAVKTVRYLLEALPGITV